MRNIPSHTHDLAQYHARREQLERLGEIATLVGRILATVRRANIAMAVTAGYHERAAQPTMCWLTGEPHVSSYRTQPRDGRGRFMAKAWLRAAESFTAADVAWFGRPLRAEVL